MREHHIVESVLKGLKTPLSNNKGFVLILAATCLAVISIAGGAHIYYKNYQMEQRSQKQTNESVRFAALKLRGVINNEKAWDRTTKSSLNPKLDCYNNKSASCCGIVAEGFTVISQTGQPVFEISPGVAPSKSNLLKAHKANKPMNGFSLNGDVCNNFDDDGAGNPDCPIRIFALWTASSPIATIDPNCKLPPTITLLPEVKRGSGSGGSVGININNSTNATFFNFVRGGGEQSLSAHCLKMNGTFDPARNQCILAAAVESDPTLSDSACSAKMGVKNAFTGDVCKVHQTCEDEAIKAGKPKQSWVFKGFDSMGQKICGPVSVPGDTPCPSGQALIGLSYVSGKLIPSCAPFPKMAYMGSCPAWYSKSSPPWPGACPSWHVDPTNTKYCYCDYQSCTAADPKPINATQYRRVWSPVVKDYVCTVMACAAGHITPPKGQPNHNVACYPTCSDYKGSGWNPGGGCKYNSCKAPFTQFNVATASCDCPTGWVENSGTCQKSCSDTMVSAWDNNGVSVGPVILKQTGLVIKGCTETCSNGWNYMTGINGAGCYECKTLKACTKGTVTSYTCGTCPP